AVLRNEQKLGSRVVERAARQLAASFNSERIASAVAAALEGASLSALQHRLAAPQHQAVAILATTHLPHFATRAEILDKARTQSARTPSVDEIVERAHNLLLDAVGTRLREAPARA